MEEIEMSARGNLIRKRLEAMKEGDRYVAYFPGGIVHYLTRKGNKFVDEDSDEEVTYEEVQTQDNKFFTVPKLAGMTIMDIVSMKGGARRRRHRSRKAHRKSRRSTRRHR
jgi:hypothetical protein